MVHLGFVAKRRRLPARHSAAPRGKTTTVNCPLSTVVPLQARPIPCTIRARNTDPLFQIARTHHEEVRRGHAGSAVLCRLGKRRVRQAQLLLQADPVLQAFEVFVLPDRIELLRAGRHVLRAGGHVLCAGGALLRSGDKRLRAHANDDGAAGKELRRSPRAGAGVRGITRPQTALRDFARSSLERAA